MRALLLLLLLAAPVFAQGGKPPQRTVRLLFLRAPSGAPTSLHLFDGSSSQEVDLPRMNFSKPYKLPPGNLTLRLLPAAVVDPESVPAAAPRVALPASVIDSYLLLSSDPANALVPVSLKLVDASAGKFRSGQILWFNLTTHAVAGTIGTRRLLLKPSARALMDPPATSRENYRVELDYMIAGDQRVHPLCETSWLHDPRSKLVAFVFTEDGRRAPRVLAFPDFRPPPEWER